MLDGGSRRAGSGERAVASVSLIRLAARDRGTRSRAAPGRWSDTAVSLAWSPGPEMATCRPGWAGSRVRAPPSVNGPASCGGQRAQHTADRAGKLAWLNRDRTSLDTAHTTLSVLPGYRRPTGPARRQRIRSTQCDALADAEPGADRRESRDACAHGTRARRRPSRPGPGGRGSRSRRCDGSRHRQGAPRACAARHLEHYGSRPMLPGTPSPAPAR